MGGADRERKFLLELWLLLDVIPRVTHSRKKRNSNQALLKRIILLCIERNFGM